ncbi:conserved Plasmodium protein, unknown function [Plasmodium sp. DRC-Itaito]|nr:conserved Plasmodium protein, unknown function [Plasmodium sp. DRC-Itaito]
MDSSDLAPISLQNKRREHERKYFYENIYLHITHIDINNSNDNELNHIKKQSNDHILSNNKNDTYNINNEYNTNQYNLDNESNQNSKENINENIYDKKNKIHLIHMSYHQWKDIIFNKLIKT